MAEAGAVRKLVGFPLAFVSFDAQPECHTLNTLQKLSTLDLRKTSIEMLQRMQAELGDVMNVSRNRTLAVAQEYVLLRKWYDENHGPGAESKKRRERASLTLSPDAGAAKRAKTDAKGIKSPTSAKKAQLPTAIKKSASSPGPRQKLVLEPKEKKKKERTISVDAGGGKDGGKDKRPKEKSSKKRERDGGKGGAVRDDMDFGALEYPKLTEDHPFWQDMATCFQKISKEDVGALKRTMEEVTPQEVLCDIPPRGRDYSHLWAESNYAAVIKTAAEQKPTAVLGCPGDAVEATTPQFDQETEMGAGKVMVGELTRNLLSSMLDDDRELIERAGIKPVLPGAPYAASTPVMQAGVGLAAFEAGLKTTLTKLGIVETFADDRDELLPELIKAQKELREKTIECSVHASQLYRVYRKASGSEFQHRKEQLEAELEAVERDIEKAYFARQAAMRRKQAPSQRMVDHIRVLIQKRKQLLSKEAELLSASRTGAASRSGATARLASRPATNSWPVVRSGGGSGGAIRTSTAPAGQ